MRQYRTLQAHLKAVYAEAHALRVQQLAEFDAFCAKQVKHIAHELAKVQKPGLDPGGNYSLETRGGSHPHTVTLADTPEQLLKKEGEAGYRKTGSLSTVPGN